MGGLQAIYLKNEDFKRLMRLTERFNISKDDVIQAALRVYESELDAMDKDYRDYELSHKMREDQK